MDDHPEIWQPLTGMPDAAADGGRRVGDDYLPPCNGEPDLKDLAG